LVGGEKEEKGFSCLLCFEHFADAKKCQEMAGFGVSQKQEQKKTRGITSTTVEFVYFLAFFKEKGVRSKHGKLRTAKRGPPPDPPANEKAMVEDDQIASLGGPIKR